jgi:hypothetical protein
MVAILFGDFPREVGVPARQTINSAQELENFILKNNGVKDCFASIYSNTGVVDKLFFDIDSPNGFLKSRSAATRVYNYLITNGFTAVAILSGKKGFHIYVPIVPETLTKDEAKDKLHQASIYIFEKSLTEAERTFIDMSVIGDIRRIARIPNTLRPPKNIMHCVVLPPNWTDLSDVELVNLAKNPNFIRLDWEPRHKLSELPMSQNTYLDVEVDSDVHLAKIYSVHNEALNNVFSDLCKPCVKYFMLSVKPPYYARLAATVELLECYKPDTIVDLYLQIGWSNFDLNKTIDQINKIAREKTRNRDLKISKKTLRKHGICMNLAHIGSCDDCVLEEVSHV